MVFGIDNSWMLDSKQQEEDEEIWDDAYITPDFLRSLDDLEQSINVKPPQPSAVVLSRSMSAPASFRRQRRKREIILNVRELKSKYKKGWLSVTDFSGLQWCEQQVYYTVTTGVQKEQTKAMKTGKVIHKTLEREISNIVDVVVEMKIPEDTWAVRFLNMITAIESLIERGIAREIPILGRVGDFLIYGIVDQVERRSSPDPILPSTSFTNTPAITDSIELALPQDPPWHYILSDTKTRQHPNLPRRSHGLPSRLQILLYRRLFDDLATGAFDPEFFFLKLPTLRPDVRLGHSLLEHTAEVFGVVADDKLSPFRDKKEGTFPTTLREMMEAAVELFKTLPRISGECEIEYRWQHGKVRKDLEGKEKEDSDVGSGTVIGVVKEAYDVEWLGKALERAVWFYEGKLETLRGVEDIEDVSSKCNPCQFREVCEWRERKAGAELTSAHVLIETSEDLMRIEKEAGDFPVVKDKIDSYRMTQAIPDREGGSSLLKRPRGDD